MVDLPHSLPVTLNLLKLAKDEEALLVLLRTRSLPQLLSFFTPMAEDESWCDSHVESVKCVLQRLVDAFITRQLPLEQAREVAEQIRQHHTTLLHLLPCDLVCLVEGEECPISSLLLGVESRIVRTWVCSQPEALSAVQKRFALGKVPLHTYRCLEKYITQGKSDLLFLSSLEQMQRHLLTSVTWELETFTAACIEVLSHKLSLEEMHPFLSLSIRLPLRELKQLCCTLWNRFDSGVELQEGKDPQELVYIVHAFHFSQWPLIVRYAEWITQLTFCGNTATHPFAKELVLLCRQVTCYEMTHTEGCDDALMEVFFSAHELRLASCPWLDNARVEQLFSHVTKLKVLDLSNNPQITKQAWNRLKYYDGIRRIRLTYYHIAQEKELILILLLLASKATDIDLSWSSGVHDGIIETFTKQNTEIVVLRLSHCENISDVTLRYCQERLYALHTLDISGDVQLSEQAIEACALNMPSLCTLDLRHRTHMMSPATLSYIRNKRPDLTILV